MYLGNIGNEHLTEAVQLQAQHRALCSGHHAPKQPVTIAEIHNDELTVALAGLSSPLPQPVVPIMDGQ